MGEHEGAITGVGRRAASGEEKNVAKVLEQIGPRLMDSEDQGSPFFCQPL